MNFENTVARFRKVSEMVDELKEYVNTLSAERDALEEDIIAHCAKDEGVYDVFRRKNSAAGIVGRNLFTVTFSEQLERTEKGARLDDQEWLDNLFLRETRCWTGTKKFLRTSKVVADFKAGRLQYILRDAPSNTGTFYLNEILRDQDRIRLEEGSIITIGATTLILRAAEEGV